jgi:hypothetical protein
VGKVGVSPPLFPPPPSSPPLFGLFGSSGLVHPAAQTTAAVSIMAAMAFMNLFIFVSFNVISFPFVGRLLYQPIQPSLKHKRKARESKLLPIPLTKAFALPSNRG